MKKKEAGRKYDKTVADRKMLEKARSAFDFQKHDPSPIMTRIINKIRKQMSVENLEAKRNIVDAEPEIEKLKLEHGSIMEYIP